MSGIKEGEDFKTLQSVFKACVCCSCFSGLFFKNFWESVFGINREELRLKIRVWGKSEDNDDACEIVTESSEEKDWDFQRYLSWVSGGKVS